ncbi:uncharacterized protein LOC119101589 [Pollicipes pollicipes]|uniref:uncharacterized protein LOC119101589 n=1 Tax=Pollicipes pollicipes TaxID=41117 RepID=UPI0018854809|nr:uncharacterized protein LOC119101589 [Pollicipes pollicipes]
MPAATEITAGLVMAANSAVPAVAILLRRQLREAIMYRLLASVAAAQVLMGVITALVGTLRLLPTPPGWACASLLLLRSALGTSTVVSLLALSVERYVTVVHGLRYFDIVTDRHRLLLLAASWLVAAIFWVFGMALRVAFGADDSSVLVRPPRAVGAVAAAAAPPHLEIDAADAALDVCCRREQHFIKVGVDASGEDLVVDVGKCRRHCHHIGGLSRKEFLQLLEEHSDTDPIQLYRRLQQRQSSCRLASHCQPLETAMQRHYTLEGAVTSEVTRRCGCVRRPAGCRRRRRLVTFHPGTPHERTLDVGGCAGHCPGVDDSCQPLRNKTVSIDGPNGAEVVSAIEECICTHGCYRMSLMEQVYDYTDSTAAPRIKEVDVGQCVGACTPDQMGRDCVWSDPSDPSSCLMSLQFQSLGCVASDSKQHFYRTQDGHERALLSIGRCSCH